LELRRLRTAAGKSRPETAQRLKQSRTAIGHLETARNLPSAAVLEVLLGFYGVPERLPFLLDLVEAARKGRNWWDRLADAAPSWLDLYLGLEAGAAELSSFDSYLVPGLLQTPEYAEAVIRGDPDASEEEIQRRVELRLGRQKILDRDDDPVRLWVVLDESVLYRQRGTPQVMAAQIQHLIDISERPRVDLQVLPLDAEAHLAQQGSFYLLKFAAEMVGDPGVVYLDLLIEGRYYDEPEQVATYERAMTRLRVQAATLQDSRTLLHRAAKEVAP
ncbi:MAG: helix-turn-helix domain-containing protein, partial [Actinobacteria bacterium]|nr:helix-turn-helix domain-containing protein [Actinomycetota bacterium]